MIEFRQKNFGILSDMASGAKLGAGLGVLGGGIMQFGKPKEKLSDAFKKSGIKLNTPGKIELASAAAGTIVGASLGLLWGLTKKTSDLINHKTTVDARLMSKVVDQLKKAGFREGTDFVRDPKAATRLKTRACIVISKVSGELQVLINTVSDPKLKEVTSDVVRFFPNSSVVTSKMSDKFNDIVISTISDSSADAGLIAGTAERFIRSGYPVYLVEVG